MTAAISPSASIVTAYKAYANATVKPDRQETEDRFGPAVKPATLSAAALSAAGETAKDVATAYDRNGNSKGV